MSAQIKDLPPLLISADDDWFVTQRASDHITYKISKESLFEPYLLKNTNINTLITQVDWLKISNKPSFVLRLDGAASGFCTINLNHLTSLVQEYVITVSDITVPQYTPPFTAVQQGGGVNQLNTKLHIGWSAAGLRVQADQTDLGVVAFLGDLTWARIMNKPNLNVSLTGVINGQGTVSLGASNSLVIHTTHAQQTQSTWLTIAQKPTLSFVAYGNLLAEVDFNATENQENIVVALPLFTAQQNTYHFGRTDTSAVDIWLRTSIDDNAFQTRIRRHDGEDNVFEIVNTMGGREGRGIGLGDWTEWNPLDPLNPHQLAYQNRIELKPLVYTQNLLVGQSRFSKVVVNELTVLDKIHLQNHGDVDFATLLNQRPSGEAGQIYAITESGTSQTIPKDPVHLALFAVTESESNNKRLKTPVEMGNKTDLIDFWFKVWYSWSDVSQDWEDQGYDLTEMIAPKSVYFDIHSHQLIYVNTLDDIQILFKQPVIPTVPTIPDPIIVGSFSNSYVDTLVKISTPYDGEEPAPIFYDFDLWDYYQFENGLWINKGNIPDTFALNQLYFDSDSHNIFYVVSPTEIHLVSTIPPAPVEKVKTVLGLFVNSNAEFISRIHTAPQYPNHSTLVNLENGIQYDWYDYLNQWEPNELNIQFQIENDVTYIDVETHQHFYAKNSNEIVCTANCFQQHTTNPTVILGYYVSDSNDLDERRHSRQHSQYSLLFDFEHWVSYQWNDDEQEWLFYDDNIDAHIYFDQLYMDIESHKMFYVVSRNMVLTVRSQ